VILLIVITFILLLILSLGIPSRDALLEEKLIIPICEISDDNILLNEMYYLESHIFMIVFDVKHKDTEFLVKNWIQNILV
jgi:GTPase SAR1 family protein